MKLSFDVECTPEELRAFFGLPEIAPMQAALLKEVEAKLRANLAALDPEALLKTWLPAGFEGFEKWREMLAAGLGGGGRK